MYTPNQGISLLYVVIEYRFTNPIFLIMPHFEGPIGFPKPFSVKSEIKKIPNAKKKTQVRERVRERREGGGGRGGGRGKGREGEGERLLTAVSLRELFFYYKKKIGIAISQKCCSEKLFARIIRVNQ